MTCQYEPCDRTPLRSGYCRQHDQQVRLGQSLAPIQIKTPPRDINEPCDFTGCKRQRKGHGLCGGHLKQKRDGRPMVPLRKLVVRPCSVNECERNAEGLRAYCKSHLARIKVWGDPLVSRGKHSPLINESPQWFTSSDGYTVMRVRDGDGRGTTNLQHRIVMEDSIGRKLVKGENVHHVNGDRADNRIENLELWNTRQPSGQRVLDKLVWAREIIALYSPLEEAA